MRTARMLARRCRGLLGAMTVLVWTVPVTAAAPEPSGNQHFLGIAYATEDGSELYREEHWVSRKQGREARLVQYQCSDGSPFARKWVRGATDDPAPDFDLYDQRDQYREGVRRADAQRTGAAREVYVQKGGTQRPQSAPVPAQPGLVIDAGFDAYVRTHWAALLASQEPVVPFLVPSRLAVYDLKLSGAESRPATAADDGPVYRFRLKLDAWYGFAAPAVLMTYTASDRCLRRFEGVSNIRSANGGSLNVRIEFPPSERYAAPSQEEINAAAAQPLVPRCAG